MKAKRVKIKRALLSVSDKTHLTDLAQKLHLLGIELISTGNTGRQLALANIPFIPIEKVTGNPESFGGRMKTISFTVASALLFRRGHPEDQKQAQALGIIPIDLVVCNLYPFEQVRKEQADLEQLIENIDIGGPTLMRSAAKNFHDVCVLSAPSQYASFLQELEEGQSTTPLECRQKLALYAFEKVADYDQLIAKALERIWKAETPSVGASSLRARPLRYGENPHQKAWVYPLPWQEDLAQARPLQGKELSYNNLLDADAAMRAMRDLHEYNPDSTVVSIVKHLNPCGLAQIPDLAPDLAPAAALKLAWAADPVSSFGSIIAFNCEVDEASARFICERFVEVVLAPSFSPKAQTLFAKKKNLRLIALSPALSPADQGQSVRSISGGLLVQEEDGGRGQTGKATGSDPVGRSVTTESFSSRKWPLAHFGIMAAKHLASNAIALVAENTAAGPTAGPSMALIGAGMGNPNRLASIEQAISKAHQNGHRNLSEAVLVSDAFFPFADSIEQITPAGIKYVVAPGGSIRDAEVISACNQAGVAMFMTQKRHFRH